MSAGVPFATGARVIMTSEMYTLHQAELRTRIGEFDRLSSNRVVLGATVSASDYINAQRLRRILSAAVDEPTVLRVARAIEVLTGWEKVSLPSVDGRAGADSR